MNSSKRVYISADFAPNEGDREVVEKLREWGRDRVHKTDFVDTSIVSSGSVANNHDCRPCDLKAEFNRQINMSSAVIIVVGDKTANRTAGSSCERSVKFYFDCTCTPYKQNANGEKQCKFLSISKSDPYGDIGNVNTYSYLQHEFEQARRKNKKIIVVYNSLRKQPNWLPYYLADYESVAEPFWIINRGGNRVGNYPFIMHALGYE